jgi:hypothetical protein
VSLSSSLSLVQLFSCDARFFVCISIFSRSPLTLPSIEFALS